MKSQNTEIVSYIHLFIILIIKHVYIKSKIEEHIQNLFNFS